MSWWSRLTGGKSESDGKSRRVDYLNEALSLEKQGDYDAALPSYRLALRDRPNDQRVLQNMAIAHSRLGQVDDAMRCYRKALELDPALAGAHYGLAFLLLKRGDRPEAQEHLEQFLAAAPRSPDAQRWVEHATSTLQQLRGDATDNGGDVGDVAGAWPDGAPRS